MFSALVGSHNYGLDDENSDKDYKTFRCPTFENIYHNHLISSSIITQYLDEEIKDIRLLSSLLKKGNPSYLEVLFSKDVQVQVLWSDKDGHSEAPFLYYKALKERREEFVKYNTKNFFNAALGMMRQKQKNLFKPTAKTQAMFDKFGYNVKNHMHIMRLSFLIMDYYAFQDYGGALTSKDKEWLMDLKYNHSNRTAKEAETISTMAIVGARIYQAEYYANHDKYEKERTELFEWLDKLTYDYVRNSIKKELSND